MTTSTADSPAKGKGKHIEQHAGPMKGKGKTAETDGTHKGKGKGHETRPLKGHGKGADGDGESKGKGKAASRAAGQPDEDESSWEIVPGKQWTLRSGDWTDPVLTYEEVIQAFAKEDSAAVKAVVLTTPEQRDTMQTLLRGTSKAHAVLIVTPDKAATQKCRGVSGGRVSYRTVAVHESYTAGLEKPQPKAMAKAIRLEQKATTVIYVRFFQRYMTAEKWREAHRNPQREFHAFMAQHRMKALDSWSWQVEAVARTEQQKIFGCARIQEGDVHTLLALSGKGGIFFDASRSFTLTPCFTEWHDQLEHETPVEYLRRMMTVPADFGLVAGSRQLGKRLKRAEGQAVQRHWLIDGVPREVTTDQLVTVLQGAGFDEIEMLVQRRRGALMEFHFRAKATFTTDCIGIPFQLGENEFALWARIAPPKRGKGTPQTISTAGSWSLEPPKSRWTTEQVALNEGEDQETNGKDGASVLDSGSTAGDVTMPPGAADKDRPAGPVGAKERRAGEKGAAKKIMAVQQRSVPAGVEVAAQPMDGNCLLHCLAAGLKELDTPKEYTAAEIRARVANHFAKNESEYRKIWDGELPNHAVSDDFKHYVREVEKDGVWGGLLELRAAARIYDTRLIIFATPVEIEPFHVHGQQKRRVIALRFNGRHYDLLRGVGGKLPKCCPNCADLRGAVTLPTNRLEERMVARAVPEVPLAPVVLARADYIEELAEALEAKLAANPRLFVATDGSSVTSVAAWAVVLDDDAGDFALGVPGEDQTPHRSEVEGLLALLQALVLTTAAGHVHVLVDCQAALAVMQGGGDARLLARRAVELQHKLRGRVELTFWWTPSHGKVAPPRWQVPPCGEAVARALNARADRVARSCATRRAAGSGRQQCANQRAQAKEWEKQSLLILTAVATRWMQA